MTLILLDLVAMHKSGKLRCLVTALINSPYDLKQEHYITVLTELPYCQNLKLLFLLLSIATGEMGFIDRKKLLRYIEAAFKN